MNTIIKYCIYWPWLHLSDWRWCSCGKESLPLLISSPETLIWLGVGNDGSSDSRQTKKRKVIRENTLHDSHGLPVSAFWYNHSSQSLWKLKSKVSIYHQFIEKPLTFKVGVIPYLLLTLRTYIPLSWFLLQSRNCTAWASPMPCLARSDVSLRALAGSYLGVGRTVRRLHLVSVGPQSGPDSGGECCRAMDCSIPLTEMENSKSKPSDLEGQQDQASILSGVSKDTFEEERGVTCTDIKLIMPTVLILLFTLFIMVILPTSDCKLTLLLQVTVIPYAFSSVIKQLQAVWALEEQSGKIHR